MTDEQRATLAKEHMRRARDLMDTLAASGASELQGAGERTVDLVSLLDELEFEEGNLLWASEPLPVRRRSDAEEEPVEVFREDEEEE